MPRNPIGVGDLVARVPQTMDNTSDLPFETSELRVKLNGFLNLTVTDPVLGEIKIGNFKWGVYAFFDYDNEPIYVGQTKETLRTRIRRHLTNQRTDAVAMSVLDPFEVCTIRVWPLPQYQAVTTKNADAQKHLDALEYKVFQTLIVESEFNAILNEKEPPTPKVTIKPPKSFEAKVVSQEVSKLRDHPDLRIARRARTLARLAQIISERKVQKGLRQVLLTQSKRLTWLAERRYEKAADIPEVDDEA